MTRACVSAWFDVNGSETMTHMVRVMRVFALYGTEHGVRHKRAAGKAAHLHGLELGGGVVALLHPVEDVIAPLLGVGRRIVA